MPGRTRSPRIFTVLTAVILTLGVMAPALAGTPDEADGGLAEASHGTANEPVASSNFEFATVAVQDLVDEFKTAVGLWAKCVQTAAERNQNNDEGDVTNPLDTKCGSPQDWYEEDDGSLGNDIESARII